MESRIGADTLRAIGRAAEELGAEAYLVGGLPRDILAGISPGGSPDVDVTLVGVGHDGFDEIARRVGGEITKRSQFGTVALRVGARDFDLVMARDESYPSPGSLPVVRSGTLAEDLARRDFSVNAMAVSLSGDSWGELRDPHGGLEDLREGTLRVLHSDSFRDDATRVLGRRGTLVGCRCVCRVRHATRWRSRWSTWRVYRRRGYAMSWSGSFLNRKLTPFWDCCKIGGRCPPYIRRWDMTRRRGRGFRRGRPGFRSGAGIAVGYAILGCGMSAADAAGVVARLRPGVRARRALLDSAGVDGSD